MWSLPSLTAPRKAVSNDERLGRSPIPSCSTSVKTASRSDSVAGRICVRLTGEVSAVVLIHPPHEADDGDRDPDERDPDGYGDTQEQQGRAEGQHDGPPAPRAEETLLRVAVVDVGVETVFRK